MLASHSCGPSPRRQRATAAGGFSTSSQPSAGSPESASASSTNSSKLLATPLTVHENPRRAATSITRKGSASSTAMICRSQAAAGWYGSSLVKLSSIGRERKRASALAPRTATHGRYTSCSSRHAAYSAVPRSSTQLVSSTSCSSSPASTSSSVSEPGSGRALREVSGGPSPSRRSSTGTQSSTQRSSHASNTPRTNRSGAPCSTSAPASIALRVLEALRDAMSSANAE